jgi:hypothetical protein
MKKVHPNDGGCWYCHTVEGNDMMFSCEFDTYIHKHCIEKAVKGDPDDREAAIIARELLT